MPSIRAKYLAIFCSVLLCMPMAQATSKKNWKYSENSLTRTLPFAPGQSVWLDVNVGDVHILSSLDDHPLQLEIQGNHGVSSGEMQSWVKQFDVNGNQANIRLDMPKRGNESGKVTLYVPASTALNVNLGIGDLKIDDIAGDKDLSLNIGDLKLGGLNPSDYGIVKNDTGIGDVKDSVFSAKQSGWLGKSETMTGSGEYHIRTHVGIGDIRLRKESLSGTD